MFRFTAGDLRRHPTLSERILWNFLRARRMLGLKFRRQHPMGPYIVDFVCLQKRIVIEVDGRIHDSQKEYDRRRDAWLRSQLFHVIRINAADVENNCDQTVLQLRRVLMPYALSRSI